MKDKKPKAPKGDKVMPAKGAKMKPAKFNPKFMNFKGMPKGK